MGHACFDRLIVTLPRGRVGGACLGWAEAKADDGPTPSPSDAVGQSSGVTRKEQTKAVAGTIPDANTPPVLTHQAVTIAGQRVSYVAETGMLPLLKSDGKVRASLFYVAYLKQDENRPERRPVTFCFNGGPGSASVWLHLGALGPRRLQFNEKDVTQSTPLGLVDNECSILHVTDLVFIDPVATGFSRAAEECEAKEFFAESADIQSVAEFIQLWTTRHARWLSPKYVCGESYGAFRAAGLAHDLHERYKMTLQGVILVSGPLDLDLCGDVLCQVLVPAYTAVAHFHKMLPPDLQGDLPKALAEAREFMRTEYASALFQGGSMTAEQRTRVVAKFSRLTGLPARVVEDHDLRVDCTTFRKELLHDRGLILGGYDGRVTGRAGRDASEKPGVDPSLSMIDGAFSAAMNAYVRGELQFQDDLPYWIFGSVRPWKYEPQGTVIKDFAAEMKGNPHLRVLVLGGQCDLVCPLDYVRYNIDHLDLDPACRANISYAEYESGHMMYVNLPDLQKLQRDLVQFLQTR